MTEVNNFPTMNSAPVDRSVNEQLVTELLNLLGLQLTAKLGQRARTEAESRTGLQLVPFQQDRYTRTSTALDQPDTGKHNTKDEKSFQDYIRHLQEKHSNNKKLKKKNKKTLPTRPNNPDENSDASWSEAGWLMWSDVADLVEAEEELVAAGGWDRLVPGPDCSWWRDGTERDTLLQTWVALPNHIRD